MKNKLVKLGVFVLLLVSLLLPNTFAMAADDEETSWTAMASMSTPRDRVKTLVIDGKIYAIGGANGSTYESTAEVYDPTTNTWTTLASMSTPRVLHQVEVLNGKIYVFGGANTDGNLSSAEVYNPATNTWSPIASMSTPRYNFQTNVIGGKIYAMGGDSASIEVYDPSKDTWTYLRSMSKKRTLFQTEVINDKIYAIGGHNNSTFESSVEVYDPANDIWTPLASMSTPRESFQTEVIGGKIYAMGGVLDLSTQTCQSSAEVYDPSSDTWTSLAYMSTPRSYFQTQVKNGKIYAMGGINGTTKSGTRLSSTEVYDSATDTWTPLASMSTPRSFYQTNIIDDKIYAIGGNRSNGTYLDSMEAYTVTSSPSTTKLKVVLEVNENLQLSVDDNLNENTSVTWSSSNNSVASVDENGVVTALATGNATITVSDGDGYTESINILVVENADTYRLAIDLQTGNTSRLTVDDYTNTATVTWTTSDSSVATITNAGRVTAGNPGLTLITATDEEENQIGQAYVRVRA